MTKTLSLIFSLLFVSFLAFSCAHTNDAFTLDEMEEEAWDCFSCLILDDPMPDDDDM